MRANKIYSKGFVLYAFAACIPLAAFALEDSEYPAKPADMSEWEYNDLLNNGSWIETPNSGYGSVEFVNTQTRVDKRIYKEVFQRIRVEVNVHLNVVTKPGKAQISIEVKDDPKCARTLAVYPDELKAVVNVAPLAKDNPSPKVLEERLSKMLIRAFSFVGGAAGGGEGSVMDAMTSLDRLDAAAFCLPGDYIMRSERYLERAGVKPYRRTPYRTACENGVAHKPTNIWENIVWREVHETPKNGLKIKFDKKAGK